MGNPFNQKKKKNLLYHTLQPEVKVPEVRKTGITNGSHNFRPQ